jgi:hypothetical protein
VSANEAPAMERPKIDDRVHVWIRGQGCHPGTVEERIVDAPTGGNVVALRVKTDRRVNDCTHRVTRDYDPEMRISGAWHWPQDHELPKHPSINIEALGRLDLRPDEILAVTLGGPQLTPDQLAEASEWLTAWLHEHGMPVAGVLILPQGSELAAIRAPEPVTTTVDVHVGGNLDEQKIRKVVDDRLRMIRQTGGLSR